MNTHSKGGLFRHIQIVTSCAGVALALLLGACSSDQPATAVESPANESESPAVAEASEPEPESPTPAEATPAPTEPPLAARVNGEGITLEAYERQVARHEAGFVIRGVDAATQGDYRAEVLDQMIGDRLIVQESVAQGYSISDADVQAEIEQNVAGAGGEAEFQEWLELNLYMPEEYWQLTHDLLLASKITAEVVATVPETAEHVHARHILVATEEEAQALRAQLEAGADFATLAVNNSQDQSTRINGGDLGWFPRGILTVPEVEEVAFNQEPGVVSEVVSTFLGFHIVETLEFDPARTIGPEARQELQRVAIENWLAELYERAIIELYVP